MVRRVRVQSGRPPLTLSAPGAELNAGIEHQTAMDTTTGDPQVIGERGAVVADTVGPRRGNPAALAFTMRHAEALSDRLMRRRIRSRE